MPRPRRFRLTLWIWLLSGLGLWFGLLWAADRLWPLPLPDAQAERGTLVVDRHGVPLRAYPGRDGVWRYPVAPDAVSPAYLEALLGYEDRRFHWHGGVDPLALLRAGGQWLWHGRIVSGGSTLSMQVARLLDPVPRSVLGKLRQMLRALQLEWHLDKRQILALYLNHAPFGGTLQGVQAASFGYLGKPADRLTDAEAALLAVLPQAPSRLRPDRHPEAAEAARNKVLQRLLDLEIWPLERVADARLEAVTARRLRPPMLAALAANRLRAARPQAAQLRASIDAELQRRIEDQVGAWARRLPPRSSAAAVVLDIASMQALAYVGSARFGDPDSAGHVDMLRAWRSPGSTLKPFVYGLAIDDGLIHSHSLLIDAPQDFDGYRPGNFDRQFRGPVDAASALRLSLNLPAVSVLDALGPARWAARLGHAGLRLRLPRGSRPHLAMVLGGTEVRLDQLVTIYAALYNAGATRPLQLDLDQPATPAQRLLSPGAAWIVRQMLRDPESDSYIDRSGRAELAAKTGTSYGFRDAWAVGATPTVAVGVWVGRPDGTPVPGHYGAISALPLLRLIVDGLPRSLQQPPPPRPHSVDERTICWPLGRAIEDTAEEHCHRPMQAWVLNGNLPPTRAPRGESDPPRLQPYRADPHSGLRLSRGCPGFATSVERHVASWPALAGPWLDAGERQRSRLPALAAGCRDDTAIDDALQIVGIADGSLLRAAPHSGKAPAASVIASGASGRVRWLLNGRVAGESEGEQALLLQFTEAGPATLIALDGRQRYAQIAFSVAL